MGSALRLAGVNLVVIAAILGLIELLVRTAIPGIRPVGMDAALIDRIAFGDTSGPRAGARGESNGVVRKVEDDGFWSYAGAADRDSPDAWLFLGDSVTMGIGVDADSTFAGRVAAWPDGLRVLNASIVGHASNDYVRILEDVSASETIRRVSVFWCLNDAIAGRVLPSAPGGTTVQSGRFMAFIRRNWRTYQWLKATFSDRPTTYYTHDRMLYAPDSEYLEAALSDLGRIKAISDSLQASLDVFLLPYEYALRTNDNSIGDLMSGLLASEGIVTADTFQWLRAGGDASHLYLYGDGIHFSAAGHRVLAQELRDYFAGRANP